MNDRDIDTDEPAWLDDNVSGGKSRPDGSLLKVAGVISGSVVARTATRNISLRISLLHDSICQVYRSHLGQDLRS